MTLFQILKTTGYPVSEYAFPPDQTPTLPFILYETSSQNNFFADNKTYKIGDVLRIRLVNDGKFPDGAARVVLENVLKTNDMPFNMVDAFRVDSENTFETIYETGVMR